MVSSMQRLDYRVAAMNGADGIPSVIGHKKRNADNESSIATGGTVMVTTTGQPKKLSSYQIIHEHGKKWFLLPK
jgi:hypothetical protein